MDICEPHRKYLFLYCSIYSALHSNGSYPIVSCVVVAQQRVYMSQHETNLEPTGSDLYVWIELIWHTVDSLQNYIETSVFIKGNSLTS
jgi:hypothetical protein